jgi:uncharacterized membrane protein
VPISAYAEAAYRVSDREFWSAWAVRALLALGAAHVLAGIVFFFAFNWADMAPFAKFAVVQASIAASALAAIVVGLDRPVGQVLLIAASVLTGVLLAVFGQVYQTGADAYELFVGWTFLMAPWVLISRSAPHWLVWLIIACLAIGLYCDQILVPLEWIYSEQISLLLGAVPLLALAAREVAVRWGFDWLAQSWTRYVLVIAALGCFFLPAVSYIFDLSRDGLSVIVFLAVLAAAAAVYARLLPDFGGFAVTVGYAGFFLMAVGGKLIGETVGYDEANFAILGALAILTFWCVGVTAGMARLLGHLRRNFGSART